MNEEEYKQVSIKEFTRAVGKYDGSHAGVYKMCRKDYPDILAEIKKKPFERLVDIGCGTAPIISLLSQEYPNAHFTGIDLTPAMIEVAKSKNLPNADFVVGDAENLPFDNDSFDVAICSESFHHYPHPQAFFTSVARVLRPGGRLIIRDVTFKCKLIRWFANYIEMPILNKLGYGDVRIYSLSDVRNMSELAGFKILTLEKRGFMRLHCVAQKR
ncbi:MAG: methyltransferase domain-containing protein [Bacteroidales bacterium]|nr:methyltransferase domain-containing protein [Bacteroidales bacterium]